MLKASMIWEKPRNNAKNPTRNKIRKGPLGQGHTPVGPRYPTAGGEVSLSTATAASRSSGPLQPEWRRGWHEEGPAEDDHFDLVAADPGRLARPVDADGVPGDADTILTDETTNLGIVVPIAAATASGC
jgi:hypothetical protein